MSDDKIWVGKSDVYLISGGYLVKHGALANAGAELLLTMFILGGLGSSELQSLILGWPFSTVL